MLNFLSDVFIVACIIVAGLVTNLFFHQAVFLYEVASHLKG